MRLNLKTLIQERIRCFVVAKPIWELFVGEWMNDMKWFVEYFYVSFTISHVLGFE